MSINIIDHVRPCWCVEIQILKDPLYISYTAQKYKIAKANPHSCVGGIIQATILARDTEQRVIF